jgi:hypothetical protein
LLSWWIETCLQIIFCPLSKLEECKRNFGFIVLLERCKALRWAMLSAAVIRKGARKAVLVYGVVGGLQWEL